MKHLKKFNEARKHKFDYESTLDKEEVQDFCETYLAYLIDDGYQVSIIENNDWKRTHDSMRIIFLHDRNINPTNIEWDRVKDNFIPFLSMLDRNYTISKGKFYNEKVIEIDNQEYLLSDVIEDNIYQPIRGDGNVSKFKFRYINIYIKK